MSDTEQEKICTGCGESKPLGEFHRDRTSSDGRMSRCKVCRSEWSKEYYQENAEKIKCKSRKYYQENKERVDERNRAYAEANQERMREYYRKYYQENRERLRKLRKRRYRENKQEELANNRRRYQKNKRRYQKSHRRWVKNNREVYRSVQRRYKANRRGAEGSHTVGEWLALVQRFDHRCLRCGKRFSLEELTEDHVVPVSKGGTDYIDNIQPMCQPCNAKKTDKTVDYRPGWRPE